MSLIVIGAVALQCSAFLLIQGLVILPSFIEVDDAAADKDGERVLSALDKDAEELASTVTDYAHWDDTYGFVNSKSESYVRENFSGAGLANIRVAFVAIYANDGSLLHASKLGADGAYGSYEGLSERMLADTRILSLDGGIETRKGFIECVGEPHLIAIGRIVRSDKTGPSRGFFVMGRRLDPSYWQALSERTGVALLWRRASLGVETALLEARADDGQLLRREATLVDLQQEPFIQLETMTPAFATERGRASGTLAILILVASGVAVIVGLARSLRILIVQPLSGLGDAVADLQPDDELPRVVELLAERSDEVGTLAVSFARMDARIREARERLLDANRDLEEKVRERTLALSEANARLELHAEIVRGTSEGILVTDLQGTILEVNDSLCQMSGYPREEMLGRNPRLFRSGCHGDEFYRSIWEALASTGRWSGEIRNRRKDGEIYPVWMGITLIGNGDGKPAQYVGVCSDISRVKKAEEKLERLAYYDPLTGLPNRVLFRDRLGQLIARSERYAERMALIFLDLDRFKDVNDSLGHAAGDALLVEAARRLVARTRKADTVCRLGGDEFTVILERIADSADAGRVAANLLDALKSPFALGGTNVYIGASAGIAVFPDDDLEAEGLTRKADAAMYHAKASGKGTYRYVSHESTTRSQARLDLETRLHRALEAGEFSLAYQPKFGAVAVDGRLPCTGAEALARWIRSDGRAISPAEFIPACEESGLIMPLGLWILENACAAASTWPGGGRLGVAVNLSMRQFDDPGLPAMVEAALAKSGLPASRLQLELTETVLARDAKKAIAMIRTLRSIGASIAMDDFGIGYSSLGMLGRLPIDVLKIDQSFVRELSASDAERRGGAESIVEAVVALASGLGLKTVAEGVETLEQFLALRDRGCDEIQGYLFGKPGPSDAMPTAAQGIPFPGA